MRGTGREREGETGERERQEETERQRDRDPSPQPAVIALRRTKKESLSSSRHADQALKPVPWRTLDAETFRSWQVTPAFHQLAFLEAVSSCKPCSRQDSGSSHR